MTWDLSLYTSADIEMLIQERACMMSDRLPWEERLRRAKKEVEGRSNEPEQVEMDLGRMEFRQQMRRIWSDY